MKLLDKLSASQNIRECIRGNKDGFDCWPPAEPKTWWCWQTWRLFWCIPIRVVVAVTPDRGEIGWYLGRLL